MVGTLPGGGSGVYSEANTTRRQREGAAAMMLRRARRAVGAVDPAKAVAFVACGALAVAAIGGQARRAETRTAAALNGPALTVPVTVAPGETLWTLARRYGNPALPIDDRIDALTRASGIAPGETLLPGQRLLVPVENPIELARLRPTIARK